MASKQYKKGNGAINACKIRCIEADLVFPSYHRLYQVAKIPRLHVSKAIEKGTAYYGYHWEMVPADTKVSPEVLEQGFHLPFGAAEDEKKGKAARINAGRTRLAIAKAVSEGENIQQISKKLGMTVGTIKRELADMNRLWEESAFADLTKWKALLVSQAREIQNAAMSEFERSRKRVVKKTSGGDQKGSAWEDSEFTQAGDSAFLNVALSCIKFQSETLGITGNERPMDNDVTYKQFLEDLSKTIKQAADDSDKVTVDVVDVEPIKPVIDPKELPQAAMEALAEALDVMPLTPEQEAELQRKKLIEKLEN